MYTFPFLISLFTAVIILVTGTVLSFKRIWTQNKLNILASVSMGILLTFSITELVPNVFELNEHLLVLVVLFLLIFVFMNHKKTIGERDSKTSIVLLIGACIHYFIDGLLLSMAFSSDGNIEVTLIVAILIHKFVETLSFSFILRTVVVNHMQFLSYLLLLCFINAIGLFSGIFLMDNLRHYDTFISVALAFSAALFIYLPMQRILLQNLKSRNTAIYAFIGFSVHFFIHIALEHIV